MRITLNELPVYYINRDKHTDKRYNMERWLTEKGFTEIHRWPGVEDDRPRVGCAKAHHTLLKHLSTTQTPFIVFEDDATPWKWERTINLRADTDAYYLGLSGWGLHYNKGARQISATRLTSNLWRLHNMLSAHGIAYFNPDYVKWLVRATGTMLELQTNQDKARAQTLKYWNVYGPEHAHVYQAGRYRIHTKITMSQTSHVDPSSLI
jgi:hypothetical protein